MKEIKVKLDDNVWRDLRNAAGVRGLSGMGTTVLDEFAIKLLKAIEDGQEEKHFFYKSEDQAP